MAVGENIYIGNILQSITLSSLHSNMTYISLLMKLLVFAWHCWDYLCFQVQVDQAQCCLTADTNSEGMTILSVTNTLLRAQVCYASGEVMFIYTHTHNLCVLKLIPTEQISDYLCVCVRWKQVYSVCVRCWRRPLCITPKAGTCWRLELCRPPALTSLWTQGCCIHTCARPSSDTVHTL